MSVSWCSVCRKHLLTFKYQHASLLLQSLLFSVLFPPERRVATHMSCARHRPSTGLCVNERFLTCVNDMSGYICLIVHVTAFEISTCFFVTPLLSCFFSLINAINTVFVPYLVAAQLAMVKLSIMTLCTTSQYTLYVLCVHLLSFNTCPWG